MSGAVTTGAIILVTYLLFSNIVQKGVGGMTQPLRQFGLFLLTKAAGPATDLFQEKEGNGAKTWMQTGVFWLVLAGIGGFLSAWHTYDPTALDSLSNIGWGYDDGSALAYFNSVAMSTAIFAILIGGALVAHARTCNAKLASEANASFIALAWTGQVFIGLVLTVLDHFDFITFETTQMALYGIVSALLALSLMVNSMITLGDRGTSPISVPSWFLLLALLTVIFGKISTALGQSLDWTSTVWVADIMLSTWAPLALMFGVGYHILSHVTGQPIWSGSLTKASMFLLFVTIPPFFLSESNHADNLTQSIGAILVTLGLFPVFAASSNMIATIRGNASAVVDSPGATAVAAGAIMLPLFAVIGYFTGLNVMIGDGSMANVADAINSSFMYVTGGLFCLGALFHSYPLSGRKKLTGSASMASWFVIAGGLISTILFLMYGWSENALIEAEVEDPSASIAGFALVGAFAFYGVVLGFIMAGNCVVKTLLFGENSETPVSSVSDISTYNLVDGTTTIRSLLGRGVGVDTTLVIGESDEEGEGGSTVIEVSASLHNDEINEFPVDFDTDLVELTKWLCGRGTTTAQFFAWADVDSSGELDLFEFANALRVADIADLPPWDIEKLVNVMDINSDGRINLPELDITLMNIRTTLGIEFIPYVEESEEEDETPEEVEEESEEEVETPEEVEEKASEADTAKKPNLKGMKKAELVELADSMGLETSGTKADLIERINKA
ncbi:MAG: SAP domain-containing protein [Euryarchaeota archaeon]